MSFLYSYGYGDHGSKVVYKHKILSNYFIVLFFDSCDNLGYCLIEFV